MKKILCLTVGLLMGATLILAQTTTKNDTKKSENIQSTKPSQAKYNNIFEIRHPSFNRKIDLYGRGELLQIEFQLVNLEDVDFDFYIFAIGTIEKVKWQHNSFTLEGSEEKFSPLGNVKIKLEKNQILYFKSDPEDKELFTYDIEGKKELIKLPKDIKKGVDPNTGKPYHLGDTYSYRTTLLSDYRRNFKFFDHVTILIYDVETEELVFRQVWKLDGRRK